jgi:dihydroxyacid dehydratase/phosphogluconate dehydratase
MTLSKAAVETPAKTGPVLELGNIVKKSVEQQNMLAWQYNTIGVSDGITMGGEGKLQEMSRYYP